MPAHLQRYRTDIFTDKYKRLSWDALSRTITAHIAKDGYWYIHPEQHRTLSIREAARLQTFPDWFRFAGQPCHRYAQIGNAVPPLLAEAVGRALLDSMRSADRRACDVTPDARERPPRVACYAAESSVAMPGSGPLARARGRADDRSRCAARVAQVRALRGARALAPTLPRSRTPGSRRGTRAVVSAPTPREHLVGCRSRRSSSCSLDSFRTTISSFEQSPELATRWRRRSCALASVAGCAAAQRRRPRRRAGQDRETAGGGSCDSTCIASRDQKDLTPRSTQP